MIMELVRNRSFTLTTDDSKQSRLRRLKNGVPQGSVLAPLLFNIYTYDLPSMISRKFAYADDLALLHSSGNWKDLEGTLSQEMSTLSAYLQTWRLKLSHTKTVTAAFHLNNREAKHELKVYNNGRLLPFCPTPTYLGVKLDTSLTFQSPFSGIASLPASDSGSAAVWGSKRINPRPQSCLCLTRSGYPLNDNDGIAQKNYLRESHC